ncbi:MAG: site-specific integrase [Fimbriimonadaceae bacterium]|nr:site-specific integrase [Fimbriimonadaceae bacterium]
MASNKTTFVATALDLIRDAERRVADGENSPTLVRDYKQRLKLHCEPFFGGMRVNAIDARKLREFRKHLSDKSLKASTALTVMSFVSKVLSLAEEDGVILAKPKVPRGGHKDAPRPAFTASEYGHLKATLKRIEHGKPTVEFKGSVVDKELRLITTFMVNSFLRPGDIFVLKHKHLQVITPPDEPAYLRLSLPPSKNHSHDTVSLPAAVFIYKNVTAHNAKKGLGTSPNDYVFLPGRQSRAYAKEIVRRQFAEVLRIAGLSENAKGEKRSLYSLRHSAIIFRLVNSDGLDLVTLARAARTSVEMIDRFYASTLTAEMNRAKLFSFKRASRYNQAERASAGG